MRVRASWRRVSCQMAGGTGVIDEGLAGGVGGLDDGVAYASGTLLGEGEELNFS